MYPFTLEEMTDSRNRFRAQAKRLIAERNALLAATPDLLAALESLVAELEEIGQRENEPDSEALTEARAAIAKARGES